MDKKCSIVAKSKTKKYTCLTKEQIVLLVNSYNAFYKKDHQTSGKTKEELYKLLKTLLKTDEINWWKLKFIPDTLYFKLKSLVYKPKGPKEKWGWLYTTHIDDIMRQYAELINKKEKRFFYYKTVPADYFALHPDELQKIKDIKIPVGIIFNTDISSKGGEHWVAVFINKKQIYFFDSNGDKPNKHIKNFIDKFPGKEVIINKIEYQKTDGVCGIYAVEYILMKAAGKPVIFGNDKEVNSKRNLYFRD